ncbi:MAG: putative selenium-dependent hydroxylase accessory protein YqeC [Treponema sp.]|jgi:probable selenium-dependent hydroxylase accessory protein YqeC|nr:putative selenium-dependent hydroxylase accessory protein YqeC [Treponema sp.]
MESLSGWFERHIFPKAPVITVTGSGGKTALIWLLARTGRRGKVLVSPSTKMLVPPPEAGLWDRRSLRPPSPPLPGITLAGVFNDETGKLEALPPGVLETAAGEYDLVLVEGDGSRGLPLKGWAAHEPVVPPFTTVTAAVMPLRPLGQPVSADGIHRLPLFTALSGAAEGDILRPGHLARVITGTGGRGLFAAARGEKMLFFNQIDDGNLRQAEELASLLPGEFLSELRWIIAGSVMTDRAAVIWG